MKEVMDEIFKDCDVKGGRGRKNSPVAVFYPRPDGDSFFPDGRYLMNVAKSLGIPVEEFYVTPIVKDYGQEKPIQEYLDMLMAEMAIVNPNVAWVIGRDTLELLTIGEPKLYYRYIFGLYVPVLIDGFFGLLVPNSHQASRMPDDLKRQLFHRVSAAVDEVASFRKQRKEGPQQVASELRGDNIIIKAVAEKEGFIFDTSLSNDNGFYYVWSKNIRGPVFVCKTEDAKRKWLATGLGLVFTAEEVKDLDREGADFLTQAMVSVRSRSVQRVVAEG